MSTSASKPRLHPYFVKYMHVDAKHGNSTRTTITDAASAQQAADTVRILRRNSEIGTPKITVVFLVCEDWT